MKGTLGCLLDFTHGRHALLSVAQPALGALLAAQGYPESRTVYLGVAAATAGMLCVYPLNDLLDLQSDREEARSLDRFEGETCRTDAGRVRHPLAQGAVPLWFGVSWVVGTGLTGFALASKLRRGCGLIFIGCIGLEAAYCALRRRTWLKITPAGSVVGLGGLAGWYAVRGLDADAVTLFMLLAFWEIFGRNIPNDMADQSLDAPVGIRTIATTYGPEWSARACLLGSVAMLPLAAAQKGPFWLRLSLIATAASTMTLPAVRLARKPTEDEAQRYFDRASLFPPVAFLAVATLFLLRGKSVRRRRRRERGLGGL